MIIGSTYGVLPEIIAGYSVNEILKTLNLRRVSNSFLSNPLETFSHDKVNVILVSDASNHDSLLSSLKNNDWIDWKTFTHPKSKNKIYGLIRKNIQTQVID